MDDLTNALKIARERERERQKKARQRARKRTDNRPVTIRITIQDPELWRRACEAEARESLISITERTIDEDCREQKKRESEAMWENLSKTRTGLMDREAAGAEIDANGNWTISEMRDDPPPRPMKRPEDWTAEEWDQHIAEWSEAYDEWESRQSDAENPETGESRRVNTRHNWERDR
jgi:hypothetical protein